AGRARLVAGLLVESALIATGGGALGVALAFAGVAAATSGLTPILPQLGVVTIDWWVMAYACAITAVTGLVFGLAPAVWTARVGATSWSARRSRCRWRFSWQRRCSGAPCKRSVRWTRGFGPTACCRSG